MKTSRWFAAALAAMAVGAQAQPFQSPAQSPANADRYLEFSYVPLRVSFGSVGTELADLGRLMLGVRVHPNVDVEAMLATGLSDVKTGGTSAGKIERSIGLFVRPGVDISPSLRAFARVGIIDTKLTTTSSGSGFSDRSVAMGLGLSYRLTDRVSLAADYTRYADFHLVSVDGTSLGVAVRF